MFGKFGYLGYNFDNMNLTSEAIDKKLKDPNTTVEDLLKEEELLQEFRSQNEKLISFFDKDKVKHLLDYIIKEQEDEKEKGYKFPFLCSQIFGLEIDNIMKYFFITNKQMEEEKNKEKEQKENANTQKDANNTNNEQKGTETTSETKDKEKKEGTDNDNKEKKGEEEQKEKEKNEENITNEIKEEAKKENNIKEEAKKDNEVKEEVKKEEAKKDNEVKEEVKKEEEKKEDEKKEDEKKEEVKKHEKKEEEKKENEVKKEDDKKEGEEEKEKEDNEENEDEKSEPESTENKIELLDYFFSFLPEESEIKLNYVLSGYFSSLITNLLNVNPKVFLKYIYTERKEVLDKMITHCYRKSISDILSKLLFFENYLQNDPIDEETKNDMNETRNMLFTDIFTKIDIDMDNEDLASIYYFITGLFDPTNLEEEKPIFEEIVNNRRIMKALITKPFYNLDLITITDDNLEKMINRRKNFSIIIDIIIFFLNYIKKLKLERPTSISDSKFIINHTRLSEEIFNNLEFLLKNNFNKKNIDEKSVLQSFNEYQLKPLGEYKIKIIDLLHHLVPYFRNISKFFDEILIDTEFFKNAFEYLYEYEWNNIYQESLLNLFKVLLDNADYHQLIQDHLFNTLKIVEIIKTHTNKEEKFKFINDISTPITHGYYSFFIGLSYRINTVLGGTPIIMSNNLARQGSFSFIAKVPEEGDKKAAMDLLYGNFDGDENNKNNENNLQDEEKECHYEYMKKFISDEWRDYFGLNIMDVIKQYEKTDWPEQKEKQNKVELPFERAKEDDIENNEDNGMSKRDKNIFGDDDEDDDDKNGERGRAGVNFYDEDPFKKNDINIEAFEFDKDDNNDKDNENPFKNNDIKEKDFEFEDNKDKNKENDIKNEQKPEEIKDKKEEDKIEEKKVEKEELKDENKKDENKKDEEMKKEKTEEDNKEQKEQNKTEDKKDNEEKKGTAEGDKK